MSTNSTTDNSVTTPTGLEDLAETLATFELTDDRQSALDAALLFHRHAGGDDPKAVVETAREFLAFLTETA